MQDHKRYKMLSLVIAIAMVSSNVRVVVGFEHEVWLKAEDNLRHKAISRLQNMWQDDAWWHKGNKIKKIFTYTTITCAYALWPSFK